MKARTTPGYLIRIIWIGCLVPLAIAAWSFFTGDFSGPGDWLLVFLGVVNAVSLASIYAGKGRRGAPAQRPTQRLGD